MVRALLDGDLPTAPTVALAAARRYRTALKAPALSAAARSYLQANLDELERRANDPARLDEEVRRASEIRAWSTPLPVSESAGGQARACECVGAAYRVGQSVLSRHMAH